MSEQKPGFLAQIKSFPRQFWVANTMEIFERMAWYGFYAVSSLYITGARETGELPAYFNTQVIQGPGAFVEVARGMERLIPKRRVHVVTA